MKVFRRIKSLYQRAKRGYSDWEESIGNEMRACKKDLSFSANISVACGFDNKKNSEELSLFRVYGTLV